MVLSKRCNSVTSPPSYIFITAVVTRHFLSETVVGEVCGIRNYSWSTRSHEDT